MKRSSISYNRQHQVAFAASIAAAVLAVGSLVIYDTYLCIAVIPEPWGFVVWSVQAFVGAWLWEFYGAKNEVMRGQIHSLWLLADRGNHLCDQRPQTHQKRSQVTPHPLPKLKRPLYARLKEIGEFFPVVLWPLLKERLLPIALCLILLSSLLYLIIGLNAFSRPAVTAGIPSPS